MVGIHIVESFLDGDIGTIIFVSVPFALAIWYFIHIYITSRRKVEAAPQVRKSAPTSTGKRKSQRKKCPIPRLSARTHGIAPVRRDHPAYQYMNHRDDDSIVCE